MKIAIHKSDIGFSKYWIEYCNNKNISYKIVDCYSTDIIDELRNCDALMWHHNHANPKDVLFAKELIFSLESAGKLVYPDIKTTWFFDDKVGQKYLLEAMDFPLIPTYVFYSKKEALAWISDISFPLVSKLRTGAGSRNVKLIKSEREAKLLIRRAFRKGIRQYDPIEGIKESIRRMKMGKASIVEMIKAFAHLLYPIQLEKSKGREKGYVYFQEFIPDCKYDIRVQLVGERIWAMIRPVRNNDFRASGSGTIDADPQKIPIEALKLALEISRKLDLQSVAVDFIPFKDKFLLTEISYCFGVGPEDFEVGYWDKSLIWHPGEMNPFGWMIDDLIARINDKKRNN